MSFLSHRPIQFVYAYASKTTCHCGASQQSRHSQHMLARIPIFLPDETKDGHKLWVSCCPFCAHTIQNDLAYINHTISAHYHANFTCGTCLSTVTTSGQQMKRHISECWAGHSSQEVVTGKCACSEHSPKKSAHGSSSSKSKHGGSKNKKSHHSGKSQLGDATSQEDSQTGDRHLTCVAGASQEGTTGTPKHHSGGKKKVKRTHKKKKSSKWSQTLAFQACHGLPSLNPPPLAFSF